MIISFSLLLNTFLAHLDVTKFRGERCGWVSLQLSCMMVTDGPHGAEFPLAFRTKARPASTFSIHRFKEKRAVDELSNRYPWYTWSLPKCKATRPKTGTSPTVTLASQRQIVAPSKKSERAVGYRRKTFFTRTIPCTAACTARKSLIGWLFCSKHPPTPCNHSWFISVELFWNEMFATHFRSCIKILFLDNRSWLSACPKTYHPQSTCCSDFFKISSTVISSIIFYSYRRQNKGK